MLSKAMALGVTVLFIYQGFHAARSQVIVDERVTVFGSQDTESESLVLLDLGWNETVISNSSTAKILPGLNQICSVLESDISKFLQSMLKDLCDGDRVETILTPELFPQLTRWVVVPELHPSLSTSSLPFIPDPVTIRMDPSRCDCSSV